MVIANRCYERDQLVNQCGYCGTYFDEPGNLCASCEQAEQEANEALAALSEEE